MQNLLINGSFQDSVLDPWVGNNAYITAQSCYNSPGSFSVILKGKKVNASIEQTIGIMPGESYDLSITAAASKWGISPPIKILLEYLDSSGQYIKDGINFSIRKGQLANWNSCNKRTFKTFHENSLKAPVNAYWAKLTIMKITSPYTTKVLINNISLTKVEDETILPTTYVENIDINTTSVVETDPNIMVSDQDEVAKMQSSQNNDQYIYLVNEDEMVSIIRTSSNTVIETIDFSGALSYQENQNIIVSSKGSTIYSASQSSSTSQDYFTMIDTSPNSLSATIELEGESVTLVLTKDDQADCDLLYVINHQSHSVSVIDTCTNELIDSFKLD